MLHMYNGRFSGLAYVKLRNRDEVKLALLMDQNHIGDRYIDVMEINDEKLEQIREAAIGGIGRLELHRMCASEGVRPRHDDGPRSRGGRGGGGRRPRERSRSPLPQQHPRNGGGGASLRTRFAYVTGFPPDTLYKGVRQFFDGCLIGPSCVHLFRAENDRFRGDGYIEFANSDELRKGLKKNNDYYQNNFRINIEPCSEQEVNDMKPYMMDRPRPSGRGRGMEEGFPGERGYRPREEYERGAEPRMGRGGRSPREREQRYGDYGDRWGGDYRHGNERGFGQQMGVEHHNHRYTSGSGGRRGGEEFKRDYEPAERDYAYMQASHYGGGGHPSAVGNNSSGPSSREKKTLRLQGLSPSTGISDIVTFFRNYGVEYEGVRLQCHDDGSPNGRAFVTFPSERIASAALHDMNRRLLKNSYVEISPVNY